MRSFGPGRSWRIATGRPARFAASRTRSAVERAVGVVESRDVHPRLDELDEDLRLA
jgi:hypothetical protein